MSCIFNMHNANSLDLMRPPQLSTPVQGRSEWEVFYAYPTISAPALFEALARVSEEQADSPPSAAQAYDILLELSRAAQVWPTRKAALLQVLALYKTPKAVLHHPQTLDITGGSCALSSAQISCCKNLPLELSTHP